MIPFNYVFFDQQFCCTNSRQEGNIHQTDVHHGVDYNNKKAVDLHPRQPKEVYGKSRTSFSKTTNNKPNTNLNNLYI